MSSEESTEQQTAIAEVSEESQAEEVPQEQHQSVSELEKQEEEKMKAKYGSNASMGGPRGLGGHSAFLQKRLQKGQKYFDSGDYQMAKQKGGGVKQVFANKVPTGEAIPTPETVPVRKTSIIQTCNKFQS